MAGTKRSFEKWWNDEGQRWLPQPGEPAQHAYVAEKAWDAACERVAKRLREVADVYEAGGHTHRAKMLRALAMEVDPWPSGGRDSLESSNSKWGELIFFRFMRLMYLAMLVAAIQCAMGIEAHGENWRSDVGIISFISLACICDWISEGRFKLAAAPKPSGAQVSGATSSAKDGDAK